MQRKRILRKDLDSMSLSLPVSVRISSIPFYSDIDSLAYFGGIHQIVFGYHRQISKRFPFAVYYRIIDNVVVVFATLDCRRNPSWIRERLMKG